MLLVEGRKQITIRICNSLLGNVESHAKFSLICGELNMRG